MSRLALLTAAAVLLLAGCTSSSDGGSDGTAGKGAEASSTPSATTTPAPTGPDCADVWQDGEKLPDDYTQCLDGKAYGMQDVTQCEDGSQLVAYADEFFAVTGGPITKVEVAPMQDTEEFGTAFATCTGE